jgi:iron(II)-dependent oxidoreductase
MRRRFEEAQSLSPPHDTPIYVWVPSGQFIIGSDIDDPYASSADRPKSPAHLDGYWISRNEVTNAQYVECMKARVCEAPNDSRYLETQYATNPVTGLTLHQARTYAQWVGGRLPTEMEWEKACRGPFGRIFPWGDADPDPRRLNYAETRIFSWLAVGSFAGDVSPYGVLDMAGNVAEWTDSSFLDNTQSELFVIKGGSYGIYDVTALRCTNLRSARASAPDFHLGFRVVFTEYPGLK